MSGANDTRVPSFIHLGREEAEELLKEERDRRQFIGLKLQESESKVKDLSELLEAALKREEESERKREEQVSQPFLNSSLELSQLFHLLFRTIHHLHCFYSLPKQFHLSSLSLADTPHH